MNRIELIKGDITKLNTQAIVNAANRSLLGGSGVDGAIHEAAGEELLKECEYLNGCTTGESKITNGYKLPASYVIHTVGPMWKGGDNNEMELLSKCYLSSLKIAAEKNIKSIAFPNISTGVYRFPKLLASRIAVRTVRKFLKDHPEIEKVVFCTYDDENYHYYKEAMEITEW